ncbi:hypothetical protein TorRG33x02_162230 [Trema orientale]|uniref:Uncharacterized protein n=1 Tax=Trema orientale TaxID=63057 RepID=A0A2P5ER51_TREOI|nr:hypothetical protein TorRG33x02_162230 [Trema orientale]
MNKCLNRAFFVEEDPYYSIMNNPDHVCPMNYGSPPESVKRTTGSSSRSHRLRSGSVLQKANEHLRSIEAYVEAATDLNNTESYIPHVIRID